MIRGISSLRRLHQPSEVERQVRDGDRVGGLLFVFVCELWLIERRQ